MKTTISTNLYELRELYNNLQQLSLPEFTETNGILELCRKQIHS